MQERETDKARNLMRKELEWIRRQPKARGTKSKSRIDAFYELKEKAGNVRKEDSISFNVKMNRIGGKVMELKNLRKGYGDTVFFNNFTYTFKGGERVGIVGKNGAGKSTFLNIITGLENADAGTVVPGETLVIGYYNQKGMKLDEDKRVIEVIRDIADVLPLGGKEGSLTAMQLLQTFNFHPKQQHDYVSTLSGGERRRLYLLTILIKNPNFLILDEPTNDLDIMTLQVLEDFLEQFMGCLIVVSHDRYFMDKLTHHTFVFEGDGIVRDFNGNYSQYREEVEEKKLAPQKALVKPPQVILKEEKAAEKAAEKPVEKAKPKEKQRMGFNEKWEFSLLEKELPELEKKKEALVEKLNSGITDSDELMKISAELTETIEAIDSKTNRWLELSEMTS